MLKKILGGFLTACTLSLAHAGDEVKPHALMVGDPAPAIRPAHWIKGSPVASFEKGQVYVVEFWATWCGPCRAIIPHLSELQKKHGDKARFISVSVWERDLAKLDPFIEQMGEKMQYTVAADRKVDADKGFMAKEWMEAAGQNTIPKAFIVDGEGRIAWLGHPGEIDEPLARVVAGDWDVAEAAKAHKDEMLAEAKMAKLEPELVKAFEENRLDDAIALMDAAIHEVPALEARGLGPQKFITLLEIGQNEKASAYGKKLIEGVFAKNPRALNFIAWQIIDPERAAEHRDVPLALSAAKRANELTEGKDVDVLDTYAMALFLSGDAKQAFEMQKKAVELAGPEYAEELKARMEKYRAAANS
jgi:thiol-disulfide isomerase/thioredoxin